MPSELVTTFIVTCLGLLVVLCGYFIKTWVEGLSATIGKLSKSVEDLTVVTSAMKTDQALDRLRNRQLLSEVRALQTDACTMEDCPAKQTKPGLKRFMPRTRLADYLSDEAADNGVQG